MVELGSLPNELVCKIVEQIQDHVSYYNFALTCNRFALACQTLKKCKQREFQVEKYHSTCTFFELPDVLHDKPCKIYKAMPNGLFYKTPKINIENTRNLHPFFNHTEGKTLHAQLEKMFANSKSTSRKYNSVRDFFFCYFLDISPVELLWAIWLFFKQNLPQQGDVTQKEILCKQLVQLLETWMRLNYNNEWKGWDKNNYLISPEAGDEYLIYNPQLLFKEMKRLNVKLAKIYPAGAEILTRKLTYMKWEFKPLSLPVFMEPDEKTRNNCILDFPSAQIVDEITQMTYQYYKTFTPSQFFALDGSHSTLARFLVLQDQIIDTFTALILQSECLELRALIIWKLLDCADYAFTRASTINYHFFLMIILVLTRPSIKRLLHSIEYLKELSPLYSEFESIADLIFNRTRAYESLRYHISSQMKPYIHPLTFLLLDGKFFYDGRVPSPFLNVQWYKRTRNEFEKFFNDLHGCWKLAENNAPPHFLNWLFSVTALNEEQSHLLSMKLEPSHWEDIRYGDLPHPISSRYPKLAEFLLPSVTEECDDNYALKAWLLFPSETPLKFALKKATLVPPDIFLPFLIENYHNMENLPTDLTKEIEDQYELRVKVILPIQLRIILLIRKIFPLFKSDSTLLSIYREWKEDIEASPAFHLLPTE